MTEYVVEVEIPGLDRLLLALEAFDRTSEELLKQALPVLKVLAPILADPFGVHSKAAVAAGAPKQMVFTLKEFADCLEDFLSALRTGNFDNVAFKHRWFSDRRVAA